MAAVGRSSEGRAATVLYDEDCGFCRWSLDKILAWDRNGLLHSVPIQSEEGARLLADVPGELWLESWHLVEPSGEVRSGGAAAAPLVDRLPGGRPLAYLFRRFPRATDRVYRLVARNRDRMARVLRIDATCDVRR